MIPLDHQLTLTTRNCLEDAGFCLIQRITNPRHQELQFERGRLSTFSILLVLLRQVRKSKLFLENIEDTSSEDLDSRLISYLFSNPVNDGGQWDMIVNLVNKYGVVPNEVFPDNAQSTNSSKLNYVVTEKLRNMDLSLEV